MFCKEKFSRAAGGGVSRIKNSLHASEWNFKTHFEFMRDIGIGAKK
jgi:hypothetical protein